MSDPVEDRREWLAPRNALTANDHRNTWFVFHESPPTDDRELDKLVYECSYYAAILDKILGNARSDPRERYRSHLDDDAVVRGREERRRAIRAGIDDALNG